MWLPLGLRATSPPTAVCVLWDSELEEEKPDGVHPCCLERLPCRGLHCPEGGGVPGLAGAADVPFTRHRSLSWVKEH